MWGNPLEGCCTLAQKHSPSIASLMGCGMEKTFPAVGALPVSRFYSRRLRLPPYRPDNPCKDTLIALLPSK